MVGFLEVGLGEVVGGLGTARRCRWLSRPTPDRWRTTNDAAFQGLMALGPPGSLDRGGANPQPLPQHPTRPVGHPQPGDPTALIAATPVQHHRDRGVAQLHDPRVRHTIGTQQHDPYTLRRRCPEPIRSSPQPQDLTITQPKSQSGNRTTRHTP
jgi:hypothetical protein